MTQTQEAETAPLHQGAGRETDTAAPPLPAMTYRSADRATATGQETPTSGDRALEAIGVTAVVGVFAIPSRIFLIFLPTIASNYALSAAQIGVMASIFSLIMSVVVALLVGSGIGFMANRRSVVGSLIAANAVTFVFWQSVTLIGLLRIMHPGATVLATMALQSLLPAVTITVAEIGIASLVVRFFRSPAR